MAAISGSLTFGAVVPGQLGVGWSAGVLVVQRSHWTSLLTY